MINIAVVGMGPTGVSVVCDLLTRLADRPPERRVALTLVEPTVEMGPGYAFTSKRILNMRAATLTTHSEVPDHFVAWLAAEGSISPDDMEYPPRHLFGRYLATMLGESVAAADPERVDIERWTVEVADVERRDESVRLTAADGSARTFAAAVLAIGEPRHQALHFLAGQSRFLQSPWTGEVADIPSGADVAVIGTGLSAVDACIDLLEQRHSGRIACFSRRRGLPKVQGAFERYEPEVIGRRWLDEHTECGRRTLSLGTVAAAIADELDHSMSEPYRPGAPDAREWFSPEGRGERLSRSENDVFLDALDVAEREHTRWYYALDSLERLTPEVWNAIAGEDQLSFLRRGRAVWNEFRHSMPLQNARALAGAVRGGQLDIDCGLERVEHPTGGRRRWEVTVRGRPHEYDYLIDATGGQPWLACEHDPLLRTCIRRGSLSADPRGGIRVDFRTCRAEDASGRHAPNLHFVGPLTFGTHFYTNSFTTNRDNASQVARDLEHVVRGDENAPRRYERRAPAPAEPAGRTADA